MITCMIHGDLGTQLYQVYATIAYCIKYNQGFMLYYNSKSTHTFYWNNIFSLIKQNIYDIVNQDIMKKRSHTIIYENPDKYETLIVPMNIKSLYVFLSGTFCNIKYFEDELYKISELLHIYDMQILLSKKYKSLLFTYENYEYIGLYLSGEADYVFYDILLKSKKTANTCILVFYDMSYESIRFTLDSIMDANPKFKYVIVNRVVNIIGIEKWEMLLLLSICNYIIMPDSSYCDWANIFHKYYIHMVENA